MRQSEGPIEEFPYARQGRRRPVILEKEELAANIGKDVSTWRTEGVMRMQATLEQCNGGDWNGVFQSETNLTNHG